MITTQPKATQAAQLIFEANEKITALFARGDAGMPFESMMFEVDLVRRGLDTDLKSLEGSQ